MNNLTRPCISYVSLILEYVWYTIQIMDHCCCQTYLSKKSLLHILKTDPIPRAILPLHVKVSTPISSLCYFCTMLGRKKFSLSWEWQPLKICGLWFHLLNFGICLRDQPGKWCFWGKYWLSISLIFHQRILPQIANYQWIYCCGKFQYYYLYLTNVLFPKSIFCCFLHHNILTLLKFLHVRHIISWLDGPLHVSYLLHKWYVCKRQWTPHLHISMQIFPPVSAHLVACTEIPVTLTYDLRK